jgi:Transposase zinc-ribbon domain/Glycosyl hydrolases family 15
MAQHHLLTKAARDLPLEKILRMREDTAFAWFCRARWPETDGKPYCPHCGCEHVWSLKGWKFKCSAKNCRREFSATSGTIFASHKLSFRKMLAVIAFSIQSVIQQRLVVDGLVRRYDTADTDDGLPPEEGTFVACSFWLVDNLVLQGRRDEAAELFEGLLALCNDVGLLAEEYDTRNFPQAFSHVALISSALNLTRTAGQTKQRANDNSRLEPKN